MKTFVRFVSRAAFALSGVLLAGLMLTGCGVPDRNGPADTYGLNFALPEGSQKQGAVVFFIDAVNTQVFEEMLDRGELPAFKKYFIDRGLYVRHAVANTPSVTLANEVSVVTGLYPGHHGITGINWFDRNRLVWRNYDSIAQKNDLDSDYTAPNIFEQFPNDPTMSVFFQPHRGATKFFEQWYTAGPAFFMGWYEFIDRLTLSRFDQVIKIARVQKRFPKVTFVYLLAVDFRQYETGVGTPSSREALRQADRQIGRVLGDMQRAGLLDKLVIALVSDHGMCPVEQHFSLKNWTKEEMGLKVGGHHRWENDPFEERLEDYEKFNAVFYGSGDRYWAICLRKPVRKGSEFVGYEPWMVRPEAKDLHCYPTKTGDADLPALLIAKEPVQTVAYAEGKNRVRVLTKAGEAEFIQPDGRGGGIRYRVVAGKDPLGFAGKIPPELLAGREASPREWFDATAGTDYPDLPAQILAYFRAPRSGDIAVFAVPGWDFNHKHRAGHGGLTPCDMFVPMILAGPGVPHATVENARTVDLMPTLLTLLGKNVPPHLDGQSILPPPAQAAKP